MTIQRPFASVALCVVFASLALTFLARVEPLVTFSMRFLVPGVIALVVLLGAHGMGAVLAALVVRMFAALGLPRAPQGEARLLNELILTLVGAPLLGSSCFLVSLVALSPPILGALVGACALVSVVRIVRRPRPRSAVSLPAEGLMLLAALVIALLMAQLPPFTLDEVTYHLAVPRAYLLEGAVVDLPLNSHSYFPFGVESLALATMGLAGEIGAIAHHFVVLGLALTTGLVIFGFLRRQSGEQVAWVGTVALCTTPALVLIAGTSWVDWPLVGCTVSLFVALTFLLDEEPWFADRLALVALSTGAGIACKYTFGGVLAATFVGAAVASRSSSRRLGWLTLAGGVGAVLGATFLVRNLVWTGNPVAPFLAEGAPHVAGFQEHTGPLAILSGYVFEPGMADESLGGSPFALVALFTVAIRSLRDRPWYLTSGIVATLVLIVAMALGAAGRLLVPFSVLAGLAACAGAPTLLTQTTRAGAWARRFLLGLCFLQLLFATTALQSHRPLNVLASADDATYLRSVRRNFGAIAWADAQLPEGSKTLVIGTQELYWFRHRVRGAGNLDGPRVARYLAADSDETLSARLARDGFTHVAVYHKGVVVGAGREHGRRSERTVAIDTQTAEVLRAMLARHARLLGQHEGMSLHELATAGPAP